MLRSTNADNSAKRAKAARPWKGFRRRDSLILAFVLAASSAALTLSAAEGLTLSWQSNVLKVAGAKVPGGAIDIWWLEAFCRRGSTRRRWNETTIPHQTKLLSASPDGKRLRLLSKVEPSVEVGQDLRAGKDEVEFRFELKNQGGQPVDLEWLEPCIRVDRFTGRNQSNYISRCFIFTERGLTMLDQMPRNEEALYRGGQVYVPKEINPDDVNPRPISSVTPANGLIGCFSYDEQYLLATAWDQTQHLFQGVIVCIHSDPHVGGLKPHETKRLRGKLYLMQNDPGALLTRYRKDFPVDAGRVK